MKAVLLFGIAFSPGAWGGCIPLPSLELQKIDRMTDVNAARAISAATASFSSPAASNPFVKAQLYAIIADASILASKPQDARVAAGAALALLGKLPVSNQALLLRRRIVLAQSNAELESSEFATALTILNSLLAAEPNESLLRSCALEARAEAYGGLNEPDRAASDAVASYRIAEHGGWTEARIQAAYELADVYSRAGLTD